MPDCFLAKLAYNKPKTIHLHDAHFNTDSTATLGYKLAKGFLTFRLFI